MKFGEQLRRDPLRLGMLHPVHHAVPHRRDRCEDGLRLEPTDEKAHGRPMIRSDNATRDGQLLPQIVSAQICAAQSDAIDLSLKPSFQRFTNPVERKLNAR
jgi:hypothetical protein